MIAISESYCDKVTATLQADEFPRLSLEYSDLVESMGGRTDVLLEGYRSLRLPDNEQILVQVQHKLTRVTLNGRACAALRLAGHFAEALGIIGASPHRVTQIHAKVDVCGDGLPLLLSQVTHGALSSGYGTVPNTSCRSLVECRPDGQLAENVYIGSKQAEMQRVYYDKRLERHAKGYAKFDRSVDEISVELRVQKGVTRKGLSLRDAYDTKELFWHYMADCPLIGSHKPAEVSPWVSSGSGFECVRELRTKAQRVADWERFGDWKTIFKLAHEVGKLDELLRAMSGFSKCLDRGVN